MIIGIDASRGNRPHKTGTEWYSFYLIRWLAQLDNVNQYILYTNEPLVGGLADLTTIQNLNKVRFDIKPAYDENGYQIIKSPHNNFKAKVLKWPYYFFWTQGRLSIEMIFNKPDILFIPSHTLPIIHPKNSIVTIHDVGFERDHRLYRREFMGPENTQGRRAINLFVKAFTFGKYSANNIDYLRWSTEYALKKAKLIITVSNFSKQEIVDIYGADKNKIKVIPNGYNKSLYRRVNDESVINEILSRYGIERPYILYVGRLERKKNIPNLIEAFSLFRLKNKNLKHKLVLIGDASYGYDEINYNIREFSLDKEVIMPGWIEELDMPILYSGADAFVFPSKYEGFGIPLLQAMACGLPIAASWSSSIPEVVGSAAIYFNPLDTHQIADAIEKVVTDVDYRETLVEYSYKRIDKFSWEKCAEKTLEVINNVVDKE